MRMNSRKRTIYTRNTKTQLARATSVGLEVVTTPQRCLGWYLAKSVPQRLSWRRHVRLRSKSPRTANRWTAALFQATKNWWSGDSKLQGLYHLGYHSS